MTDIFLSYSSKDREKVRPLRDALAALGYDVFWDQETPAGVDWETWIKKHLAASRLVIVLWSKNSAASGPVKFEAKVAKQAGKLLPAFLEKIELIEHPIEFSELQTIPLHDSNGQAANEGYAKLVKALRERLGSQQAVDDVARDETHTDIVHLRRRADAGDGSALAELGDRYRWGWRGVEKNLPEARRLFELSAAKKNPRGQAALAGMYKLGEEVPQDDTEAVRLYKLSADRGYPDAQVALARMYERGDGVGRDLNEAARLFRLAAEQGNSRAQYALADMYELGRGVPKDEAEAARLFKRASGHADANYRLGVLYEEGRGVAQNLEEAARLYEPFAEELKNQKARPRGWLVSFFLGKGRGVSDAAYRLAHMHESGRGVEKNEVEAIRLLKLAAAKGHKKAEAEMTRRNIPPDPVLV